MYLSDDMNLHELISEMLYGFKECDRNIYVLLSYYMSHIMRKSVFGVSDQVPHKLENLDLESREVLSM